MHPAPLEWWTSKFPDIAPVGHVLRWHLKNRWSRFHSLPESKRYAEDASECAEILRRHLAVGHALFEVGEQLFLFRSRLGERKLKGRKRHQVAGRQLRDKVLKLPAGLPEDGENSDLYFVRALVTTWVPDFFEVMTRQVADWQETGITLVSPATMNIYSPYDGGLDVFAFTVPPSSLDAQFPSWLSGRADRL